MWYLLIVVTSNGLREKYLKCQNASLTLAKFLRKNIFVHCVAKTLPKQYNVYVRKLK